ncbi:sensor histidine kinase [Nonomuraea antimicrobica]
MIVTAVWMPRTTVAHDLLVYGAVPATPWYVSVPTLTVLLGVGIAVVGVVAFGTSRVVGRTLRPVRDIRTALDRIASTDLGSRVPVPAHHDEIWQLATTVNQTLRLLETAMQHERQFTSDASHDLRSPIAAMRLQVEEALTSPEPADWRQLADGQLAGLERLQAIVTDLLAISRLDGVVRSTDVVDLSHMVTTELKHRAMCAGPVLVSEIEPCVLVIGDVLEWQRLLANLLDNAGRHADSTVTVRLTRDRHDAVLEVADDGPGVPPEKREEIFRRFVRLADSRAKDAGGTGLGLAIARQIAERHHGSLTLADSDEGACFVTTIPLCPSAAEHQHDAPTGHSTGHSGGPFGGPSGGPLRPER